MMIDDLDQVMSVVVDLAANTHPDKMKMLAKRISEIPSVDSAGQLDNWATNERLRKRLKDLIDAWRDVQLSSSEIGCLVTGATFGYQRAIDSAKYELVWTGPSTAIVPTRKTAQVLLEVISSAEKTLFITSFVAYKVESILDAIREAIARDVKVELLLESSKEHGGSIDYDVVQAMRDELPGAKIYTWTVKEGDFEGGKVHAKVAVADGCKCFLTSANLTGHAMEKNMEAGILCVDGPLPKRLHDHLLALVTAGVIE